jgi:hypothetical protein
VKLDRPTQTVAGLALVIGGMWVIHEAWEGRGHHRPFLLRILPG